MLSQPVDLVSDFTTNSGGVIVDADTFQTFGGTLDGIRSNSSFLVTGKTYKLIIAGNTTSSGFTMGNQVLSGNEYGSGFGTHYFVASGDRLWIRQTTSGTTNITSFSIKEIQGNPANMTNMVEGNITNIHPLTKIRNYYRMGDGIMDGYPIIQDQTSPNLAHIPTTNLIPFSENFNGSVGTFSYSKIGSATVTPNSITAPDGTNTGTLVTKGTNTLVIRANNVVETNKTYAFSCYVKSSGSGVTSVSIDISDGTTPTFTLTNDWQRISVSSEVTKTPLSTYNFVDMSAVNGSQGDTFYTWGWQVEEQSQATAYLKSDGIAAVRKSSTTNLIPYSEDFNNAAWSRSFFTFTANYATAPDGSQTAYRAVSSGGSYPQFHETLTGLTIGQVYTVSFYVKSDGTTQIQQSAHITSNGATVNFTPTNDWVRIEYTRTATATSHTFVTFTASGSAAASSYLIWGYQVEQQTQAETYAKTTGLPVTIDLFTENNYGTMTNMSASDIVEDTP